MQWLINDVLLYQAKFDMLIEKENHLRELMVKATFDARCRYTMHDVEASIAPPANLLLHFFVKLEYRL